LTKNSTGWMLDSWRSAWEIPSNFSIPSSCNSQQTSRVQKKICEVGATDAGRRPQKKTNGRSTEVFRA
jgi:hypothetical protein